MKFAFLIYLDEAALGNELVEQTETLLRDCFVHFERLRQADRGLLAERLLPVETATTIRVRGDDALLTDGPFAETKEQLAGLYVIDCVDTEDALRTAAQLNRVHGHPAGCIEVRPVLDVLAEPRPGSPGTG